MSRFQWVFRSECGCPFGVLEDGGHTIGEAWSDFYEGTHRSTDLAVGRAVARGVTLVKVEHERYVSEFYPQMLARCPHGGGAS